MTTVKYYAEIDNPYTNLAYIVDGAIQVPLNGGSAPSSSQIEAWVAEGNTISPAFTQQELNDYEKSKEIDIQDSMIREGQILGVDNTSRVNVLATPSIEDQIAYDQWLLDLYTDKDSEPVQVTLFKPPETERQKLAILNEDQDRFTFTRYQDPWGSRWLLELFREDVNALSIAIYDAQGNYLYTTGALIDTGNGSWYTECPAGQADPIPEDVYFKWLLGSANISSLEVYKGSETTKEGVVRSDERYD